MKELTIAATIENMVTVTDFVDEFLDDCDCPLKIKLKMDIAVDEIFSNISNYAYADGIGNVKIRLELQEMPKAVCITFSDSGIPYNPLARKDPDTTLSAEERKIGGLGIYMVKKSMDEVSYLYSDGENHLTLKKCL